MPSDITNELSPSEKPHCLWNILTATNLLDDFAALLAASGHPDQAGRLRCTRRVLLANKTTLLRKRTAA